MKLFGSSMTQVLLVFTRGALVTLRPARAQQPGTAYAGHGVGLLPEGVIRG